MIGQIYPIVGGLDYLKLKSVKKFEKMSRRELEPVGVNTGEKEYAVIWPINIREIANDIAQSRLVMTMTKSRNQEQKYLNLWAAFRRLISG
ncbi:hypothetical protein [Shewanella baltica]|uniref:hypothetical protein n=1 Tax=Shewanella baltica TaxID=62322 RepID=UPI003D7B6999